MSTSFPKRFLAALLVFACAFGVASAQQAVPTQPVGPNPDQPEAESIYKHIPADCMGFVAAKNFNALLKSISTFAGQIGMGEQLEAMAPGGLLPMVAAMLQLGEGYNPNGGVALVVLDFEKAGIDVDQMIRGQGGDIVPPIVILLAGKDIEKVFPTQVQKDEKGVLTVVMPVGGLPPLQTAVMGDYIALSPSPKALELMKTEPSLEAGIPEGQKKLLATSDLVLHENVTVISPLLKKIAAKAKEDAQAATDGTAPSAIRQQQTLIGALLGSATEMLDEMISLSYGLRFVEEGILVEVALDYKPGGKLAEMVRSYTPTDKPLMNRLPNLPYVLASGTVSTYTPEATNQMMKALEMLLAMGQLEMPADLKERMITLGGQLGKEITGIQFVVGAPKEKGVFGLATVLECRDAAKVKALLPKETELLTELIQKTLAVKVEDLAETALTFQEGVETVDGQKVDAIVLDTKKLKEMSDQEKKEMVDVLGEDQIRFLVAQADEHTLVLTFGGGTEVLSAAIQAAQSGGTIPADAGVAKAMTMLPRQRVAEMILNPKNLFDTIQAGMKKTGEPSDLPEDFAFQNDVPVAMNSTFAGTTARTTTYIPSAVVKDVVAWIMAEQAAKQQQVLPESEQAPQGGEETPAEEGEEDF